MNEDLHPDDACLASLAITDCQKWLPDIPFVAILRDYGDRDAPPCTEKWAYKFVLNRLAADGAFDGTNITPNANFCIATRTKSGQRIFVQTKELA